MDNYKRYNMLPIELFKFIEYPFNFFTLRQNEGEIHFTNKDCKAHKYKKIFLHLENPLEVNQRYRLVLRLKYKSIGNKIEIFIRERTMIKNHQFIYKISNLKNKVGTDWVNIDQEFDVVICNANTVFLTVSNVFGKDSFLSIDYAFLQKVNNVAMSDAINTTINDTKTMNSEPATNEARLKEWYLKKMKKVLDLDNPRTLSEKIQWMKLYDSTITKSKLTDKYLVRFYVEQKIGKEYLTGLYGVYNSFDEIPFEVLPNRFVIKATHGCGYNIIVKDKNNLDMDGAKNKCTRWLSQIYGVGGLELHYQNIRPRIIVEEYLGGNQLFAEDLPDYKIFCFNGVPQFILVICNRHNKDKRKYTYDIEWNPTAFRYNGSNHPQYPVPEKPKNSELLIDLTKKLAHGLNFVRVDLYSFDNGDVKFGELTFTPASGLSCFVPSSYGLYFGEKLKLPQKT